MDLRLEYLSLLDVSAIFWVLAFFKVPAWIPSASSLFTVSVGFCNLKLADAIGSIDATTSVDWCGGFGCKVCRETDDCTGGGPMYWRTESRMPSSITYTYIWQYMLLICAPLNHAKFTSFNLLCRAGFNEDCKSKLSRSLDRRYIFFFSTINIRNNFIVSKVNYEIFTLFVNRCTRTKRNRILPV